MIKTALLIIIMSGHGIVYENPYSTMKQCLADKTAVAEQINDRYGVSSVDVLCVPDTDHPKEIFGMLDKLMDKIPERDENVWRWNQNSPKTRDLCNQE